MQTQGKFNNLSSGEIAFMWETYVFETMAKCVMKHFLQHVDDDPTRKCIVEMDNFSTEIIKKVTFFFEKAEYPVPQGFTEKDVNLSAPRLFSDTLYIELLYQTCKLALPLYQLAFLEMVNENLKQFYKEIIEKLLSVEMKIKSLKIEKGIYIPTPRIPTPSQVSYVKKDSFLAGWIGEKRPLLGLEIAHLVFNAKRNGVGHAVITGFSQVAHSKEVTKYFIRGKEIAEKQIEVFMNVLHDNDLPTSSMIWTSEVTNSTVAPYSDKLMLQMITTLIASGMQAYGTAMSMTARKDLGVMYNRLMGEVGLYAEDGAEILIKNGWMEQPPIAVDRKKLAK